MSKLTQTQSYDYTPITARTKITLPGGARIAVVPYINIEHFPEDIPGTALLAGTTGFTPDVLNYGWRDYGNRVGIWRIISLLDKLKAKATICLNSEVIREYPQIVDACINRDWAIMAHGINNAPANFLPGLDEQKERALIKETLDSIEQLTGKKVKGWLSPFLSETYLTPRLLAELGVEYLCDFTADDLPFEFKVPKGSLLSVPYSLEVNDIPAMIQLGNSAKDFADLIIDQFDMLYEEGAVQPRVMPIVLHSFLSGQGFRTKQLQRAFDHICKHPDVWIATADEINEWYRDGYLGA